MEQLSIASLIKAAHFYEYSPCNYLQLYNKSIRHLVERFLFQSSNQYIPQCSERLFLTMEKFMQII